MIDSVLRVAGVLCFILVGGFVFEVCAPALVRLPGYNGAVVICGEAITINWPNRHDKEIKKLIRLAEKRCQ